jgi:hypothetical protein
MALLPVHSYGRCLNNRLEPTLADDPRWPAVAQKRARKIKVVCHLCMAIITSSMIKSSIHGWIHQGRLSAATSSTSPSRTHPSWTMSQKRLGKDDGGDEGKDDDDDR